MTNQMQFQMPFCFRFRLFFSCARVVLFVLLLFLLLSYAVLLGLLFHFGVEQ